MTSTSFNQRAHIALNDGELRGNFRRAMDGLMAKRRAIFPDADELQNLRDQGERIKARALSRLPELLEQLERNCRGNGIQVHWAETVDEACAIVLEIARRHDARRMVKGKSMVSEEMELNHFMEQQGIECLESDLGEYIVQLAGEKPSHIIMPAIHKNRRQIARLFEQEIADAGYTEDVDELTAIARRVLREKFAKADIGISGVNFAVAETGTLCLIENEGNGRMSTTAPPVHIAVTGIEKVVQRLGDIPPLLTLLTRSATGQHITTYVNMISSPRREGELDGPDEVHLVLLDNGRSRIYSDPQLQQTLRCIRCGACMNHCPVYTRVGGHTYGAVYPGPIGKLLTSQMLGLDVVGDLVGASSLCGACGEVCPVRIPIPDLLLRLRREGVSGENAMGAGSRRTWLESSIWKLWAWWNSHPRLYRLSLRLIASFGFLVPKRLGGWTSVRKAPRPAVQSLHQMVKRRMES
jgi:L-lactate dehydrogenase complex protein LldF